MIHDWNTAVMLESVEERVNHQTTSLSFQAVLFLLRHVSLGCTVNVLKEDVRGTNHIPLKFLVVGVERTVESVGTVGGGCHGTSIVLSVNGSTVPEQMPAVGKTVKLTSVWIT